MPPKDFYALLGVPRDAPAAAIKKAYRRQARLFHPDMNRASSATQRMAEINEANAVLSDPAQRAAYDAQGAAHAATDPPGAPAHTRGASFRPPEGWADFFHFGGPAAGPQPGADHYASITLDLQDAYLGAQKTLHLRGASPPGDGPGAPTALEVQIPVGVCAGQHIRLARRGGAGVGGGAPGDLLLEVQFRPLVQWRTQGRDVYGPLLLSPWEATLGPWLEVATPVGTAEVKIPTPWRAGRSIRLKGRGIPASGAGAAAPERAGPGHAGQGRSAGDLYLELAVVLPPADSATARDAYAAMALAFTDFRARGAP